MLSDRAAPLLVLIASVAVVGGALLFQYVGGLAPCELCLAERWPWYLSIGFAFLAVTGNERAAIPGVMAVCGLLLLANTALAFYHVGVEFHWFAGPTACTGTDAAPDSLEAFRARLLGRQQVRCDEVQWALFGVSLAGWNMLASAAVAIFCGLKLKRAVREGIA